MRNKLYINIIIIIIIIIIIADVHRSIFCKRAWNVFISFIYF